MATGVLIGRAKALYELPWAKGQLFVKTEIHTRSRCLSTDRGRLPLSKKQKHSRDIVNVGRLLIACQFQSLGKTGLTVESALNRIGACANQANHRLIKAREARRPRFNVKDYPKHLRAEPVVASVYIARVETNGVSC